jgi:RNA polymerase sigma factor (sigma-70 family)
MLLRRPPANDQPVASAPRAAGSGGPADDAGLLARITERDLKAFEELYRRYHPRLTRFLMNILRHPQLTEEALNDTMMVVWKRPEGFNGASKVSTWIFAIAYRTALKARSRHDEPMEDDGLESRPSGEAGAEQQLGQRQTQEILMSAMAQLSSDHRAVVDLTYFHDVGYREIAEILDCPVGTVKTRMHHARRHLKTMLAGRLTDWL